MLQKAFNQRKTVQHIDHKLMLIQVLNRQWNEINVFYDNESGTHLIFEQHDNDNGYIDDDDGQSGGKCAHILFICIVIVANGILLNCAYDFCKW